MASSFVMQSTLGMSHMGAEELPSGPGELVRPGGLGDLARPGRPQGPVDPGGLADPSVLSCPPEP